MAELERIIFVGKNGTLRAPMAMGIMSELVLRAPVEILARGMVVQFPEPINPKVDAVLISNGIDLSDYTSQEITAEDITDKTLLFVLDEKGKQQLEEMFPNLNPDKIQILTAFVGEELDVIDPYGGTVQTYGLCFESLRKSIKKLVEMLNADDEIWQEREPAGPQ